MTLEENNKCKLKKINFQKMSTQQLPINDLTLTL